MLTRSLLLFCIISTCICLNTKAQTCVTIEGTVKDQNQFLLQSVIVNVKINTKNLAIKKISTHLYQIF
jgi:hypothetical protein